MTINANQLVNVTPAVAAPGGSNFVMSGFLLTNSLIAGTAASRVPSGVVLSFASALAVAAYFGGTSIEASLANNYFLGYDNSAKKPANLLIAEFPYGASNQATSAYVRGGTFGTATQYNSSFSNGTLNITIDGALFQATGINVAGTNTFSAVAAIVQTALQAAQPVTASATASSITGTTLTVGTVTTGTFAVGQVISGSGVTTGTTLTALLTGSGSTGSTFTVSVSQTVASTTITGKPQLPTVIFDPVSAAFVVISGSTGVPSLMTAASTTPLATQMLLTAATGATVSAQGGVNINGAGIAPAMSVLTAINPNWAGFTTVFEPSTADKVFFAAWTNQPTSPYWYAMWDSLTAAAVIAGNDVTSAGYLIALAGYGGTIGLTYNPAESTVAALMSTAMFTLGAGASINYNALNGRITLAYRTQAGMLPTITDSVASANVIAASQAGTSNYSFYGSYGNQGNQFICFQNGSISGSFRWWDSYTNQIWLNNNIQTSLIQLLKLIGSVPYNATGYSIVYHSLYSGAATQTGTQPQTAPVGPIAAAVNFGAIRPGVVLSANQILEVNNAAGVAIDGVLNQVGWYLQVLDPGATVRVQRGSPIVNFWYMDGQSIQYIAITSINVQ
jgi:hypothetical protein